MSSGEAFLSLLLTRILLLTLTLVSMSSFLIWFMADMGAKSPGKLTIDSLPSPFFPVSHSVSLSCFGILWPGRAVPKLVELVMVDALCVHFFITRWEWNNPRCHGVVLSSFTCFPSLLQCMLFACIHFKDELSFVVPGMPSCSNDLTDEWNMNRHGASPGWWSSVPPHTLVSSPSKWWPMKATGYRQWHEDLISTYAAMKC